MGCRAGRPHQGEGANQPSLRPISRNFCRRCRRMPSASRLRRSLKACGDGVARGRDHGGGIAMGAAGGFLQDLVDHAESQHVLRRDLHAGGDFLGLGAVAPQDRGRRLRRDHAVDRVFEHQHPVRGGDRDGAARHALAGDDRDIGHAEREAGVGRACDRFRLRRAPRRRCRDRRRRNRRATAPECRSDRPSPSAARPCDSLRGAPCRNCA